MQLPGPLRAAVGLAVTAAGEARHLPDRAIELPMQAVSTALALSLRAQQRYAQLAARGDAVLNRRPIGDDPPSWATFDDDEDVAALGDGAGVSADDAARASSVLRDLFGTDKPTLNGVELDGAASGPARSPARKRPAAKKAAAKKTAARKGAARKAATPASEGKSVPKPRGTSPSRFDTVEDD